MVDAVNKTIHMLGRVLLGLFVLWQALFLIATLGIRMEEAWRKEAMLRSPRTVNSRPMMITTIHAGTRCISTSETNAAEISSLSAIGSSRMPSVVTSRRRRAS